MKLVPVVAASLLLVGLFACSHSVEGTGQVPEQTSQSAQPLPSAGEACRCVGPAGQLPPDTCCQSGLVCGDAAGNPGQTRCDAMGCWRSGICVEGSGPPSTSTTSSSGSSGLPAPPPDECSPFKRDNDTCPPGKECHLVRDHWGCV